MGKLSEFVTVYFTMNKNKVSLWSKQNVSIIQSTEKCQELSLPSPWLLVHKQLNIGKFEGFTKSSCETVQTVLGNKFFDNVRNQKNMSHGKQQLKQDVVNLIVTVGLKEKPYKIVKETPERKLLKLSLK